MTQTQAERPRHRSVFAAFKIGIRSYESKLNDCGKINCQRCGGDGPRHASHGPYWYLCFPRKNKWYRIYLGKELDTTKFITADGNLDWEALRRRKSVRQATRLTNAETDPTPDMHPDTPPGLHSPSPPPPLKIPDRTGDPSVDPPRPSVPVFNMPDKPHAKALFSKIRGMIKPRTP